MIDLCMLLCSFKMLLFPAPYLGFPETLFLNEFSNRVRKFSESIKSAFEVLYETACNQAGKSDSDQVFIESEHPGAGPQVLRTSALLAICTKQVKDEVAGFRHITMI